jgi:hypothetical protein
VPPITVGRLQDQIVRGLDGFGIEHDLVAEAAEIARKHDAHAAPIAIDRGRSEDVTGMPQRHG